MRSTHIRLGHLSYGDVVDALLKHFGVICTSLITEDGHAVARVEGVDINIVGCRHALEKAGLISNGWTGFVYSTGGDDSGTMTVNFESMRKKLAQAYDKVVVVTRCANIDRNDDGWIRDIVFESCQAEQLIEAMDDLRSMIGAVLAIKPCVDITLAQIIPEA